jgi:hypothetical protein
MGKRTKKPITVTIINPEALPQASIKYTKALFSLYMSGSFRESLSNQDKEVKK